MEDPRTELDVGLYRVNEGESLEPFSRKPIFSIIINLLPSLFHLQVFMMFPNNEKTLNTHVLLRIGG